MRCDKRNFVLLPRMKTFLQQLWIEFKLYFRSPGSLLWSFLFPIVTISGLGLQFNEEKPIKIGMGVVDEDKTTTSAQFKHYLTTQTTNFTVEENTKMVLDEKVKKNEKTGYIIIPKGFEQEKKTISFHYNPYQIQSNTIIFLLLDKVIAEYNLQKTNPSQPIVQYEKIQANIPQKKSYISFLVPGLLSLQIMSYCLWGIGFVMLSYREKGNLKRISVTPIKKSAYIMAQLTHRYLVIMLQVIFIVTFAYLTFHVKIEGNLFALWIVLTLGMFTFMALGFLLASIMPNLELCIGVNNLLFLSMMALSGIFFPTENLPVVLQKVSSFLPLTHLSMMVRGVYVEGTALWHYPWQLLGLGICFVLSFLGSIFFFRWT